MTDESLPMVPRPLTDHEEKLIRWLLEHGRSEAGQFLPQVADARVVGCCPCGCASVDFAIKGQVPPLGAGMNDLAHYSWQSADASTCGVFVYACGDLLGGLEVWSADGETNPTTLPEIDKLKPIEFQSE